MDRRDNAAQCWLRVERRTIPGETAAQAVGEIQEILDAVADEDPAFTATCEKAFARHPFEVAPDATIAGSVRAAASDVLGTAPPDAGQTFWTDAALLQAAGTEGGAWAGGRRAPHDGGVGRSRFGWAPG